MSNIDPRTPGRGRTSGARNGRWNSEPYTEGILAESGRRTMTLSETRRAAVLRVLLAEATRLRELSLRAAQRPVGWLRPVAALLTPRFAFGLTFTAAATIVLATYALFGGARISAGATLQGSASISERRFGPFGLQWNIAQPSEVVADYALHHGDGITADGPITITYADGSRVVATAGSHLSMSTDGDGVVLVNGEIASSVVKSASGNVKFRVDTAAGSIAIKGTEFRVQADDSGVVEFTDEGRVIVTNNAASVEVSTGEQVRLNAGAKIAAELQAPRVTFETRITTGVISNKTHIPFTTRIYPGAAMLVVDANTGRELARYTADAMGNVHDVLPEITGSASLQFRQQTSTSDTRVSALSNAVSVQFDRTPPTLAVTQVQRDGDVVHLAGRTEVKAEVRIDGKRVDVNGDGTFSADLNMKASTTMVEITAIDLAGNTTTMTQALK